jgi:nitrogen regulatory protein PII
MKMLMIICPENRQEEVRDIIAKHDIRGYSEIHNVLGEGATGKHLGTHTWPGKSVLVFTVVASAKKDELVQALKEYHESLLAGEGLRVFALPVESIF